MHALLRSVAHATVPLARMYVARAPWDVGRKWVFDHFHYRHRAFQMVTRHGFRVQGHTAQDIQRCLYWFGVWEPSLTAWIAARLRPGDTFVDVGANIGYFSLLAAGLVGSEGRVVAVEASPSTYEQLRGNLALNGPTNVRALKMAAGRAREWLVLYRGTDDDCGRASLLPRSDRAPEAEIEVAPLDDLIDPAERARLRLVKIDVEGAELSALEGAASLIADSSGAEFVVETWPEHFDRVVGMFREAGYHGYLLENGYRPDLYYARRLDPRALRLRGETPSHEVDLVFSRTDAESI
jgi:FkbM family methyltransferase